MSSETNSNPDSENQQRETIVNRQNDLTSVVTVTEVYSLPEVLIRRQSNCLKDDKEVKPTKPKPSVSDSRLLLSNVKVFNIYEFEALRRNLRIAISPLDTEERDKEKTTTPDREPRQKPVLEGEKKRAETSTIKQKDQKPRRLRRSSIRESITSAESVEDTKRVPQKHHDRKAIYEKRPSYVQKRKPIRKDNENPNEIGPKYVTVKAPKSANVMQVKKRFHIQIPEPQQSETWFNSHFNVDENYNLDFKYEGPVKINPYYSSNLYL